MDDAQKTSWPKASITQLKDGGISVAWSQAELTNEALEEFVTTRLDDLLSSLPSSEAAVECVVDFSSNYLSEPQPLSMLLHRLRQAPLHMTSLRLHKNRLDDIAATVLAQHIKESADSGKPLMQLHLSGNAITANGVEMLIKAAHRSGAYPRPSNAPLKSLGADRDRRALWLRVEQQRPPVEDPQELLGACEMDGFPVCIQNRDEPVPDDAVVQMHLAFVSSFSDVPGKGKGQGKSKSSAKGWWSAYNSWAANDWSTGAWSSHEGGWNDSESWLGDTSWQPNVQKANKISSSHQAQNGEARGNKGHTNSDRVNAPTNGNVAGKGSGKAKGRSEEENEVMAWLAQQREKPGTAGILFEGAWKAWCRHEELTGKPRGERVNSIFAFREAWNNLLGSDGSTPSTAAGTDAGGKGKGTADTTPHTGPMSWLNTTSTKGAAGK